MAHGNENVRQKTDNQYHCDICTKSFTRIDVLQSHLLNHLGKKPFQCNYCKKSFNQRNQLKQHRRTHTGERPYSCKHCDFTSKQGAAIKRHLNVHTIKCFQCPICEKVLRSRQSLDYHMKNHNGERPYSCKDCNASFSSPNGLRSHTKYHTAERMNCPVCQKSIISLGIRKHMNIHRGGRARPFTCSKCNKTFREIGSLQHHVFKHNYECTVCKVLFSSAEALSNHMTQKHEVECKICKKVFSSNKRLCQHMTTHAGEGQTKCKVCRKRFEKEELLVMHMLYSCTNHPFRCTVCIRYFTKKDNLKRHMKLVHEKSDVQHEAITNISTDKVYGKKINQENKTKNGENCNADEHKTCMLNRQTVQKTTEKKNNFGNIENTFKCENILDQNCTETFVRCPVQKQVIYKEKVSAMKLKPVQGMLIDNNGSERNKSTVKHTPLREISIDNHRAIYTDHSIEAILRRR